jgi:acyl-[acyl carrier protein]--UDP-N-acetylglucosamine O-acyltransferase
MRLRDASDIAPGLLVAPGVEIPDDAEIDPYVTIYGGVVLGARVRLGQGSVIGRPQRIDADSRSPRQSSPGADLDRSGLHDRQWSDGRRWSPSGCG